MVPCDHEEADNQATDPPTGENVVMYIIGRAKRAPHWGVQSRFRVIYMSVCMSVVVQKA